MTYQLTKLVFEIPTGCIADRFGLRKSAVFGFALILSYYALLLAVCPFLFLALVMGVFVSETTVWLMPVLYTLSQTTFAVYAPVKYTIFQCSIVSEYRATIISTQSRCIALGGVASYLLTSLLSRWMTLPHIILILGAGACACYRFLVPKLISRAKECELI